MTHKLSLVLVIFGALLVIALPAAGQAGCCQTRGGCFQTDSEDHCTLCTGVHYQLGVCDDNGTCQPTAPGQATPASFDAPASVEPVAEPLDGWIIFFPPCPKQVDSAALSFEQLLASPPALETADPMTERAPD